MNVLKAVVCDKPRTYYPWTEHWIFLGPAGRTEVIVVMRNESYYFTVMAFYYLVAFLSTPRHYVSVDAVVRSITTDSLYPNGAFS